MKLSFSTKFLDFKKNKKILSEFDFLCYPKLLYLTYTDRQVS